MSVSLGRRRTLAGVLVATAAALLLRFYELGWRVFHWDEGRVGYWILRYMESGVWEYRPIVHGPFLFHVNKHLFRLVEVSDFWARAPVAIVGGLLPLAAWLLRDRLRDVEVVAVAAFLAVNPVLLYYSRFMRNDVLVGAFAFLAFALAVRAIDTRQRWYLVPSGIVLGLAFTTKENALLYVVCWVGAALFLLDHRLLTAHARMSDWTAELRVYSRATVQAVRSSLPQLALGVLGWLVVIVVFYAPRPAFGDPAQLGSVVYAATIGAGDSLVSQWISGGLQEHSYIDFLKYAVKDAVAVSLPIFVFGLGGFLYDRYAGDAPRDLVAFCGFWAVASFLGYPAAIDLPADWSLVHTIIPLSIPAAVGVRLVVDKGMAGWERDDRVGAGLAAIVLLAVVAQVGMTAYDTSYAAPQADSNPLVQYGQPASHIQDELEHVMRISRTNEGTDVLFVGPHFDVSDESRAKTYEGVPGNWFHRLPLPWYLERGGAEVESVRTPMNVEPGETPPVVIARAEHYPDLDPKLDGYKAITFELTSSGTETVIWIDESAL